RLGRRRARHAGQYGAQRAHCARRRGAQAVARDASGGASRRQRARSSVAAQGRGSGRRGGEALSRQRVQGGARAARDRARGAERRRHGMSVVTQPIDRTDGPLKVTGEARYAAEFQLPRLAHAVMVQSTIAKGTIVSLDASGAQKAPGVLLVISHLNAPKLPQGGKAAINPPAGRTLSLLQDNVVHYNGQPIA